MIFDKNYKILAVDDAKDSQMLLAFDLQSVGCEVISAGSGKIALSILATTDIDLIILDLHMPGLSGLATLEIIKDSADWQMVPVIMLSSSDGENEIVSALELGASDYVVKPYISKVLFARMRTALRLREKTKALEDLAKTDFLTGIKNRACFDELCSNAISQAQRNKFPIVFAMFDIDFFKQVNDDYGHEIGDKVLIAFASCLAECFRDYDIVARIGGEEFAVCLPNTLMDEALIACERFRVTIAKMRVSLNNDTNKEVDITVSIGVASSTSATLDMTNLLRQADIGLYHAKSNGRNQVVDADQLLDNAIVTIGDFSEYTEEEKHFIKARESESEHANEAQGAFVIEGLEIEIGMANVLGDEQLYKDILLMFYQDHAGDVIKLSNAIENNDYESSKHLVHTLKGVSCSVGAMQLFEVTKLLDIAINEKNEASYAPLLKDVVTELNLVMQNIDTYLASATDS